jgi:flagellar motor switch protein FliM
MDASVLRRKLTASASVPDVALPSPGVDRAWRLALARAARDQLALTMDVARLDVQTRSLAELMEMPTERSLIAILDESGGEGLGVLAISPAILSGMIETLTTGRIAGTPPAARKPTRTDAAMVAGMIDAALSGLETVLEGGADQAWAAGYRYASFLDDPRPLSLLLDDVAYRVIRVDLALAQGARGGDLLLALPLARKAAQTAVAEPAPLADTFGADLAAQVAQTGCCIDAVLGRLALPLSRIMALAEGEVLALPCAAVDQIGLEGAGGCRIAEGKLGQIKGMRAVRLTMADPPPDTPVSPSDGRAGADGAVAPPFATADS